MNDSIETSEDDALPYRTGAPKVSPQATVEPLTDEQIDMIARPFSTYNVASGSREFDWHGFTKALVNQVFPKVISTTQSDDQIIHVAMKYAGHCELNGTGDWGFNHESLCKFSRALLAATPPASKALEPSYKSNYPGFERLYNFLPDDFMWGDSLLPHHMDHIISAVESVATSKADTVDRNAVLEEAAKVMDNCYWGFLDRGRKVQADTYKVAAKDIRALKSATPSTIKAEPTGEQA